MEFKLPKRMDISNKADYGRVLNVAGSDYMPGAAYLSCISALKIGCGYCFLCSTDRVIQAVSSQTQNVVFVPLNRLEEEIEKSDVIEIGCGLSQSDQAVKIFDCVIKNVSSEKPVIIDADGINILAKSSETYFRRDFKNVILTPHPKEAARLLNCNVDEILKDVAKSAFEISKKYKCITVLKTNRTVVTSNNGQKYINKSGNNSLAKAGTGDVLTGMISGLIAQKSDLYEGTCLAVYLHGLCADILVKNLTPYCVMAQDLIDSIPYAIKNYLTEEV